MTDHQPTDGWIWEKMLVGRPSGTHLSDTTKVTGGFNGLARDDETNDLETHAVLLAIEEPDEDSDSYGYGPYPDRDLGPYEEEPSILTQVVGTVLVIATVKAAEAVAPLARAFWDERALPAVRSKWTGVRERRARPTAPAPALTAVVVGTAEPASVVSAVPAAEGNRPRMRVREARERFAAAVAARLFSDEQFRLLRDARIEPDSAAELEAAARSLSPPQVQAAITAVLDEDPSLTAGAAAIMEGRERRRVPLRRR